MSYTHVTELERYQIEALLAAGWSQKAIAARLRRHPSTLSRELRRNRGQRGYRPAQAQRKALSRQAVSAGNAQYITSTAWRQVEGLIRRDWSPEQVSGTTGLASTERIYQYIAVDKRQGGTLWRHLRCRKKRRKRYGSGVSQRGQIKARTPISQRPGIVDKKVRIGDWEGDTVISRCDKAALVTLVERRSQRVRIRKVPNREASTVAKAISELLEPHRHCSHTLTLDNGKEFARHQAVHNTTGIDVYFADPYASWQRGLNEQINGLIRQYVPKGTSIADLSPQYIAGIERKLNNRPRKRLGYTTPLDVFNQMAQSKRVALRY